MSARSLLDRLDRERIDAWAEADRLHLSGQRRPAPDLLAELRANKGALLALFVTPEPDPMDEEGPWPEHPYPALGTPERARLDRNQAAMIAGLLASYRRHTGAAL